MCVGLQEINSIKNINGINEIAYLYYISIKKWLQYSKFKIKYRIFYT